MSEACNSPNAGHIKPAMEDIFVIDSIMLMAGFWLYLIDFIFQVHSEIIKSYIVVFNGFSDMV